MIIYNLFAKKYWVILAAGSAFRSRFFASPPKGGSTKRASLKSGCKPGFYKSFIFNTKNLSYFLCFILLYSCGKITPEGNIETKQTDLGDFTKLDLDGNFRVFYVKSLKNFVTVETYQNIGNNIKINVKDKTLFIKEKRETNAVDFYNVTIYSKYDLNEIKINKLAEMNLSSEIKTDHFKLFLNNNAKFIGSIQSRRADVEMDEMSRANFTGRSEKVYLKLKDTANIIAPYWRITNLQIEAKNQPYAEVNVLDSITGKLENTSKFLYYNDPIRAFKIGKETRVTNQTLK